MSIFSVLSPLVGFLLAFSTAADAADRRLMIGDLLLEGYSAATAVKVTVRCPRARRVPSVLGEQTTGLKSGRGTSPGAR